MCKSNKELCLRGYFCKTKSRQKEETKEKKMLSSQQTKKKERQTDRQKERNCSSSQQVKLVIGKLFIVIFNFFF